VSWDEALAEVAQRLTAVAADPGADAILSAHYTGTFALLPTVGGQTALNLAVDLSDAGVLEKYGVELIGAKLEAIKKAEDRLLEQMVASEEYDRRIKAAEQRLKEVEGSARTQRAAIESEKGAADKELALVEADRKRVTSEVPEDLLDHYERIAKKHGGKVFAESGGVGEGTTIVLELPRWEA